MLFGSSDGPPHGGGGIARGGGLQGGYELGVNALTLYFLCLEHLELLYKPNPLIRRTIVRHTLACLKKRECHAQRHQTFHWRLPDHT
jgi:hypothetical protein